MKRLRLGHRGAPPNGGEPPMEARPDTWTARALDAAGTWLVVDQDLKVTSSSAAAREFFAHPDLPASLIAVTRTAQLEPLARQAVAGEAGPWTISATHFQRVLRVRGARADESRTILFFDDITELRRLEAMRADFVANLAHELRTPVASLSLAAETLTANLPPNEQRLFIDRVAEETRYIGELLRTVSELAILENDVVLSVSDFRLRDVVEETWRRVTDRLGPVHLEDAVAEHLMLTADRVRVAELLQNLLENAHRFSPPGAAVMIGAEKAPDGLLVWIEDQGPGIPPHALERVFERFYKVDRARTRRGDGSGLGLAIARHLVSAHGGRIWASASTSGGTRISFTLADPETRGGDEEEEGPAPGGGGPSDRPGT